MFFWWFYYQFMAWMYFEITAWWTAFNTSISFVPQNAISFWISSAVWLDLRLFHNKANLKTLPQINFESITIWPDARRTIFCSVSGTQLVAPVPLGRRSCGHTTFSCSAEHFVFTTTSRSLQNRTEQDRPASGSGAADAALQASKATWTLVPKTWNLATWYLELGLLSCGTAGRFYNKKPAALFGGGGGPAVLLMLAFICHRVLNAISAINCQSMDLQISVVSVGGSGHGETGVPRLLGSQSAT